MKKLLVIADPHIRGPSKLIAGLNTYQRFVDILAAAVADHADAEALILLGDLTHDGDTASYERIHGALKDVPFPVIPMLGNHDQRDTFRAVFRDAPQTADGHIQSSQQIGDHHLITLDTLDGPPYPTGHHSGWLCDRRLAWLDEALAKAKDHTVIVGAHHPPHDTGIAGMDGIKLRNGTALMDRLSHHGSAYLLCGHLHRTVSGVTAGVPWSIFKSTGHQGPLDLHNPDSSLSIDEPPCYGVVLLNSDGVIVHQQDMITGEAVTRDPTSV